MRRTMCVWIAAGSALLAGCQTSSPNQPLDQSKIIAVRPAVPDGARGFIAEQQKREQERKKQGGARSGQPSFWQRLFGPKQAQPQPPQNQPTPQTSTASPSR